MGVEAEERQSLFKSAEEEKEGKEDMKRLKERRGR